MNTSDDNQPHIHWHTDLDAIPGQPVVAGDLLLVPVQANGRGHVATLHAFDLATGASCWQQAFEHAFISGLSAADDLLLISLTSADLLHGAGALLAVDPATGEERWPGERRLRMPGGAGRRACRRHRAPARRAKRPETRRPEARPPVEGGHARSTPPDDYECPSASCAWPDNVFFERRLWLDRRRRCRAADHRR